MNHMLIVQMCSILLRCLTAKRMFCDGLDPLLMKMDLWRSDTNTCSRGRTSFVLIGCERSGEYRCRNKEFVIRDTRTRKCRCPFKLRGKPVVEGQGWVKLICGIHNHELAKSLVGHPYVWRLSKAEKTLIGDMTKSMVKPRNILLTLKEHNVNSCTTIKQIYNARSAYHSSIRGSDTEMQHLMKLLEQDQYIHWHKLKDEDVVRDIFWCHPDAVKLANACNLVQTPTARFCWVTPTGITFSAGFAYLEGEHLNNVVWALECFRGIILRRDVLPGVMVCTHLLIELAKFAEDYIKLFGGTNRFEDLRMSLHVDGLTTVTMDKWMDITDMGICDCIMV
ncbi:hypothetical protein GmHk_15G044586 [Glycine max]|nr:hypothetical protein GmHk_15G044586 [Glycine max]